MKKDSCGAILFTIYRGRAHVILGREYGQWMPFKGVREYGETLEEAAIREIREETCGIVYVERIHLSCIYSSLRKTYHIGLVYVNPSFLRNFYEAKKIMTNDRYLEKTRIKLLPLNEIWREHYISYIPAKFFIPQMKYIEAVYAYLTPIIPYYDESYINGIIYNYEQICLWGSMLQKQWGDYFRHAHDNGRGQKKMDNGKTQMGPGQHQNKGELGKKIVYDIPDSPWKSHRYFSPILNYSTR